MTRHQIAVEAFLRFLKESGTVTFVQVWDFPLARDFAFAEPFDFVRAHADLGHLRVDFDTQTVVVL